MSREERDARSKARLISKKFGQEEFVVCDGGQYDYCDARDLDTFYAGATVVACYDHGEEE